MIDGFTDKMVTTFLKVRVVLRTTEDLSGYVVDTSKTR